MTYLYSACSKIWDFKLDLNRRFSFCQFSCKRKNLSNLANIYIFDYFVKKKDHFQGPPKQCKNKPDTLGKLKCALIKYSLPPGNDLMVQIMADCSGAYLQ